MGISYATPNFTNLLELASEKLEKKDQDPRVKKLRNELKITEDEFEKLKIIYLILEIEPTNVNTLLDQIRVYLEIDQFQKAFETSEMILSYIKSYPKTSEDFDLQNTFNHVCGVCKKLEKKYAESIEYFDIVLQNGQNIVVLQDKIDSLIKLKKNTDAEESCKKLLEIDAHDLDSLIIKAECLEKLKKYSESINYYKKALSINPENIEILHEIAGLHMELEEDQDAIMYYDKILKIQPDEINAQTSKFLISKEDVENLDLLAKINEKLKADPRFLTYKCLVLHHMKKFEEFSECLNEILIDHELDPIAFYFRKRVDIFK